ncbi:esterase/lipase family protein [Crocosphaera sp. XPORK-15E]|uniref:esterase/lipase family protein n=1 Tax=Crocosphaera sp. XPORK-15E TaxID=3110247 RepID=UPI002B216216|nr:alpha/beta fold hydrolase [Crocosphaera sp. XPORK-15E]MEA5534209.1 alpha/beta fold hydrolase [Crocosphaera sp. XPORK-15E]
MNHNQRNPVLLVHGLYNTVNKFNTMTNYLTNLGWSVHSFNLQPNNGDGHLDILAEQVNHYINNNFEPNQPLDLIGFSMGGIITRYYLQRLGGIDRVHRYISISAPNNGTLTAYALSRPGIKQMRPNSQFLQDLNKDIHETLSHLNITIIWTPYDLMIFPAHSSKINLGTEIKIPVFSHEWMVRDTRLLNILSQSLSQSVTMVKN